MTSAFGDYELSYPPEVLRGYVAPEPPLVVGAAARRAGATAERTLTVTPGEPGAYEPELAAKDRPRNVTELRARARVADPAPWPRGAYVLIGTSGKRAHWDGDDWHSDDSPGYAPAEPSEGGGDAPEPTELPDDSGDDA